MKFRIDFYYNLYIQKHTDISMTVRIQIASDLHIEYDNDGIVDPLNYITPSADVLVLAGDIGSFYKYEQLHNFLSRISEYFKYVIYVPGNHEYYQPSGYKHMKYNDL